MSYFLLIFLSLLRSSESDVSSVYAEHVRPIPAAVLAADHGDFRGYMGHLHATLVRYNRDLLRLVTVCEELQRDRNRTAAAHRAQWQSMSDACFALSVRAANEMLNTASILEGDYLAGDDEVEVLDDAAAGAGAGAGADGENAVNRVFLERVEREASKDRRAGESPADAALRVAAAQARVQYDMEREAREASAGAGAGAADLPDLEHVTPERAASDAASVGAGSHLASPPNLKRARKIRPVINHLAWDMCPCFDDEQCAQDDCKCECHDEQSVPKFRLKTE